VRLEGAVALSRLRYWRATVIGMDIVYVRRQEVDECIEVATAI